MMGTKEEDVIKEPEIKPVFVEDMNEAELATSVSFPTFTRYLAKLMTC